MDPEIEAMQRRLREMEEEAEKLKDEHEKVDDAMASENAGANAEEDAVKKQEADATEEVRTLALPCTRNVSSLRVVLRSVSYVKPAPR